LTNLVKLLHHRPVVTRVNLYEAKTNLSDLVERAAGGEEIVIAKNGKAKARLVPVPARLEPRRFGQLAGRIVFGEGWEDDVTDQFEDA
jgi:prevent-host-death family protein